MTGPLERLFNLKDGHFDCQLVTHFDSAVGQVEIVSQDMGRVLLNLYNNAFYAVWERTKGQQNGYQPMIEVRTHRQAKQVVIHVQDNGTGVLESVKAKIFQPFFTTKPTGKEQD